MLEQMFIDEEKEFYSIIRKNKEIYTNATYKDLMSAFLYTFKENGIIKGYVGLNRSTHNSVCICYLYVYPQYRKQGVATRIIRECSNKTKGDYLYGFVHKDNKVALEYYKKRYRFLNKLSNAYIPFDKECVKLDNNNCYEFLINEVE